MTGPSHLTGPRYLIDLVHRPAGAGGDRPAIVGPDGELSYTALWERAGATAELLRRARVRPGDLVGLYLHRSADYVTSLLATLAVGAVAVPIDPELPSGRAEQMLAAAAPRLVLYADRPPAVAAPASTGWRDVRTARAGSTADLTDRTGWLPPGEHAALVLFTSGSTGRPKGVVLHHAGLVNRLAWGHEWFGFGADDRVLHKASIGFDASVHEILSPLIAGGAVVVAGPGLQFDSLGLVRLIQREAVTTAHFVPTMLRHVLDEPEFAGCLTLRRVLCGGEALDMRLVRRLPRCCRAGCSTGTARARRRSTCPTGTAPSRTRAASPRSAGSSTASPPTCSTTICGRCPRAGPASCGSAGSRSGWATCATTADGGTFPRPTRRGRARGSTAPATWCGSRRRASWSSAAGPTTR